MSRELISLAFSHFPSTIQPNLTRIPMPNDDFSKTSSIAQCQPSLIHQNFHLPNLKLTLIFQNFHLSGLISTLTRQNFHTDKHLTYLNLFGLSSLINHLVLLNLLGLSSPYEALVFFDLLELPLPTPHWSFIFPHLLNFSITDLILDFPFLPNIWSTLTHFGFI